MCADPSLDVNSKPPLFLSFSHLPTSLALCFSLRQTISPPPRFASYLLVENGDFTAESIALAGTARLNYKLKHVNETRSAASPAPVWTMDATGPKEVGRRTPRKTLESCCHDKVERRVSWSRETSPLWTAPGSFCNTSSLPSRFETPPHDFGLDTGLDIDILVIQSLHGPVAGVTVVRDPAASAFIRPNQRTRPHLRTWTLDPTVTPSRFPFCFETLRSRSWQEEADATEFWRRSGRTMPRAKERTASSCTVSFPPNPRE